MKNAALTLLSGLLLACATLPPAPPPTRRVVVRNPQPAECELLVDSKYLRRVPPGTAVLLTNMPTAEFELGVECPDLQYRKDYAEVEGQGVETVEFLIPGEAEGLADRTASLLLVNPSPFDLDVSLNGEESGRVFARSSSLFPETPSGLVRIRFTDMRSRGGWAVDAELPSIETSQVDIDAPMGSIELHNDGQENVSISVFGRIHLIEAKKSALLEELPPGSLPIAVRFLDSGRSMELPVALQPGERKSIQLSDSSGSLIIENHLETQVELFMDGQEFSKVEPGGTRFIRNVAPGKVVLRAVTASGAVFEQPFVVSPDATETWVIEEGSAQLLVRNLVGEKLSLRVDGRLIGELPRLGAIRFSVPPGEHELAARCEATGTVSERKVDAVGSELTEIAFGPEGGRLLIENRSGRAISFFRNGKPLSVLADGEIVEFAGLPLGRNLIEGISPKGLSVYKEEVEVKTRKAGVAHLVVADVTTVVIVLNKTGEPVKPGPGIESDVLLLEPDSQTTVRVEGANGIVKFKGTNTGNRYDRAFKARPGETVTVALTPMTGGVAAENATHRTLEVRLGAETLGVLPPGQSLFRDGIPPGRYELVARDGENPFQDISCIVKADSWYMWKLAEELGSLRILNRTKEDLRIFRSGVEAGVLTSGFESVFDGLPEGAVFVSAVGITSRSIHRFTFTAVPGRTTSWIIKPATAGVKLVGFGGRPAIIAVDDIEVARVGADTAEPVSIALEPGSHVVKVRFDEGNPVAATVHASTSLVTVLDVGGNAPQVEVRNQTPHDLRLAVDSSGVTTVPAGAAHTLLLDNQGLHTVTATTADGKRRWVLKDLFFRKGGDFGWTISE